MGITWHFWPDVNDDNDFAHNTNNKGKKPRQQQQNYCYLTITNDETENVSERIDLYLINIIEMHISHQLSSSALGREPLLDVMWD